MRHIIYIFIVIFLALPVFAQSSQNSSKQSSLWDIMPGAAKTRLISGEYDSAQNITDFGLEIQLEKNWHTYWRTPGDGGLPLTIDHSGSKNIANIELIHPTPTRFSQEFAGYAPIETFGYENEVIFPLIVTAIDPAQPIILKLSANYGVCDEICIFRNSQFEMTIKPDEINDANHQNIKNYRLKTQSSTMAIQSINHLDNQQIIVTASSIEPFINPDIFLEAGDDLRFPKPQVTLSNNDKIAQFTISYQKLIDDVNIADQQIIMTVTNNGKLLEKQIILPEVTALTSNAENNSSMLLFILFAIIGGLILNIMPCVLPVLSLKIFSIMKHAGGDISTVRSSFLMTIAGILTSFIALAIIVISLKEAGHVVGWGFHFQEPLFLIALVIILNMFAANQWDIFNIHLPSWLGGRINTSLQSKDEHTPMGNFLTGVFATLMATPCSAPFLGTAISFALSQGTAEIFIIFLSMGVGLSLPYIVFTLFPSLISKLPKPGVWMVKVKHFLGILLLLTSAWLIWVLSNQLGLISAMFIVILTICSFILLILRAKTQKPANSILYILIIIGLAVTFYLPHKLANRHAVKQASSDIWVEFNEQRITQYLKNGKIIFVDITADWCLTCKVNKWNILQDAQIVEKLSNDEIVAMRGDISSPNPTISRYLNKNGRYGIPFNIVYGPQAPNGIMLSEILSKQDVIDAIELAK